MNAPPRRWAIGFACAGWASAVSYTVQRLASWAGGEVPASSVIAAAHIPFYWRVDMAVFHGALMGLLGAMWFARNPNAASLLRRAILTTIPLCALALLWVP